MNKKSHRKMAQRVARRTFEGSTGTSLSTILQRGTSKSRMVFDEIEGLVERAVRLIDDSDHKDHIYSEAGDMISNMKNLLSEAQEGLAIISYAAAKIDQKKLRNDLPAKVRDKIDDTVKKDT